MLNKSLNLKKAKSEQIKLKHEENVEKTTLAKDKSEPTHERCIHAPARKLEDRRNCNTLMACSCTARHHTFGLDS